MQFKFPYSIFTVCRDGRKIARTRDGAFHHTEREKAITEAARMARRFPDQQAFVLDLNDPSNPIPVEA